MAMRRSLGLAGSRFPEVETRPSVPGWLREASERSWMSTVGKPRICDDCVLDDERTYEQRGLASRTVTSKGGAAHAVSERGAQRIAKEELLMQHCRFAPRTTSRFSLLTCSSVKPIEECL